MNQPKLVPLFLPDTDDTRAMLQDKRKSLLAELQRRMQEVLGAHEDELPVRSDQERATETLEQADLALHLNELSLAADELCAVNDALAAISAGTYGCCISCGNAIKPARLAVNPITLECLACASRGQSGHRWSGR